MLVVKDHKKYASFDYHSYDNPNFKLGQVVYLYTPECEDLHQIEQHEIGVIIQIHKPDSGDEFRTDAFGNCSMSNHGLYICKPATKEDIEKYRPELLDEIVFDNNFLIKLLEKVKKVYSCKWSDVRKIVEFMPSIEVLEKQWSDKFKQDRPEYYPLDLTKIDTWSTYDKDCIDLLFSIENGKLICDVKIYDGHSFGGYRGNLRFTAKLKLPDEFIENIEYQIFSKLNSLAEDAYESFLKTQKLIWMDEFKKKFLF